MERNTEADRARTIRVRTYLGRVRDVQRSFRVPVDTDLAAVMRRAALAALPKPDGWHLVLFSVERTSEGERIASVLDRLARHHMDGDGFAAALAATLDGGRAMLAVAAKDPAQVARLRTVLAGRGR